MHPTLGKAILGGAIGTALMTGMMYMVAPMMGLHMDIAAMLGSMMGGNWAAGMAAHLMLGTVVFPALYTLVLFAKLPGAPVVRGATWGVGLWLMAQLIVMPMMGAGVFSSNAGGMMAAAGSLMGHLLYGGALGAIAGSGAD